MGLSQGVTIFYLWAFPKSHSNNANAYSGNPESWRGKGAFLEKPQPILVLGTASPWRKSVWKGWAAQSANVQTGRALGEQSWTFPEHSRDSGCEQPKDEAPQTGSPLTQIPPPKKPLTDTVQLCSNAKAQGTSVSWHCISRW